MSKKKILYLFKDEIENSVLLDRRLSSLSKPCDVKR